ncbi:flagellar capping protein FliD [Oryzihumus leptocrescens]|uniref:Flagellar hook-associated protein 2 n=1 Tax=Oryzihumus leptocrescens TaxID=297536 RepID=A0A542Z9C8_9MICO|nr:flagellar capping protein FliD [Oryzihumus leptocrescens]
MGTTIDGLISGMNTTQIIAQLMQIERLPEQQMTQRQTTAQNLVSILQGLNSKVSSLQTAAQALIPDSITKASVWQSATATTSDPTRVTATAGTGAVPGSIAFTISSLATAGAAVSIGTVGDTSTTKVAAGPVLVGRGGSAIGLSSMDFANTWQSTSATHSVQVKTASAGATVNASGALASTINIVTGSNDTLAYVLDGKATSITLAAGSYTPGQLAAEVQRASGNAVRAVIGANGNLSVTSVHEGSKATLQVTGGSASALLGFSPADMATAAKGADGIITVDGTDNTLDDVRAGGLVTLNGSAQAAGGFDQWSVTLAGGLRQGSATASSLDLGASATLSDVVSKLNASGLGLSAAAVQVSSSAYRLQLTSTTTGANSDISLGASAFAGSTLGGTQQLTAGSDTVLHVGTGPGAYDVTSSTTTVKGLLPGVDVTALKADPSTTVTLNVAQDTQGMADKVKAMVDQANSVLHFISSNSTWDPTKKTGGPLMSSSLARSLASQISSAVIGSSTATPSSAGIAVDKDGNITFDQTKFMAAWAKDPASVQSTLTAFGQQISDLAKQASDPIDGLITNQVKGQQQVISDITNQIADFEVLMTQRQDSLQRQYASLETALGQLQSQSQWLAGQLGSISANSSSSK